MSESNIKERILLKPIFPGQRFSASLLRLVIKQSWDLAQIEKEIRDNPERALKLMTKQLSRENAE